LSSFQHNETNTHITIRHPDDNDDAELTHAKKRQKYCHLPRMASLMASTYCAGTQYTQYLDASVGPSWIPYKKKLTTLHYQKLNVITHMTQMTA
jgi:hypothetical protein